MFKGIGLVILMNILVNAAFLGIIFLIEYFFGVRINSYGTSYLMMFISSSIFGFTGAIISLFLSKWLAKRRYSISIITLNDELNSNEAYILNTVADFSERNNISIPEIGIYQDTEANAFTVGTGKNNALISFSSGLVDGLNKDEIEGIIAHEIATLINGDMLNMALMQGIINTFIVFFAKILANLFDQVTDGKFGFLGYMGVNLLLQILFGILATPLLIKFSHYRAKKADIRAAEMIGKEKMILSLVALSKGGVSSNENNDDSFDSMKITSNKKGFFAIHPALDDRIKTLEELRI